MGTENLQFYRCDICGNLVQMIFGKGPIMQCCGQEMTLLHANRDDSEVSEKHVPVFIKFESGGAEVRVGSVPHPMLEEHHIMFIETISEDKNHVQLKYLYPGEEAKMYIEKLKQKTVAKEYCNIHGLWEGESD